MQLALVKELVLKKLVLMFAVVVRSHGVKKELAELVLVLSVALSGLVVVLLLLRVHRTTAKK
jgi:hypothetical protein